MTRLRFRTSRRQRIGSKVTADVIASGRAVLGVGLGAARIKANLIDPDGAPLATASHGWENQFIDRRVDVLSRRVWMSLQAYYAAMADAVEAAYAVRPQSYLYQAILDDQPHLAVQFVPFSAGFGHARPNRSDQETTKGAMRPSSLRADHRPSGTLRPQRATSSRTWSGSPARPPRW